MAQGEAGVVVVGAGLAGLCSAVVLARGGRRVTVLEGAASVGGRARTHVSEGFALNLGPHALYRKGRGRAILGELGVSVSGAVPRVDGIALRAGVLHALPTRATRLVGTSLFAWSEKLDFARVLGGLSRIDTSTLDGVPVSAWLEQVSSRPRVREVLAALIRVSTYADDTQALSAGAAVRQVQRALSGVLYLDGGWQSLVDGLRQAAVAAGADVRSGSRVARVDRDGTRVTGVVLDDGTREDAEAVVLTGAPQDAALLLPGSAGDPLRAAAHRARPVTAVRHLLGLELGSKPFVERATVLSGHCLLVRSVVPTWDVPRYAHYPIRRGTCCITRSYRCAGAPCRGDRRVECRLGRFGRDADQYLWQVVWKFSRWAPSPGSRPAPPARRRAASPTRSRRSNRGR
jgi:protoporphyrinogen oxidase